jgi:ribosome recycling factor
MFKKDLFTGELKAKTEKSLESLRKELGRVRTGRASLALLDGVRVNYYGAPTPLAQVASLSVPDARTIAIQPWDPKVAGEIEKAIQKSDLGLMPLNDGKAVRINIPPLTEERRKELVKVIKRIKGAKKDKEISEDDQFKYQDEVQKWIDKSIQKSEEIARAKEKEVLEI